jgi:hypothetical protein
MLDITNKLFCNFEDCNKIPSYNFENEKKAIYCFFHKLDNMINIKSNTCCEINCKRMPIYNFKNEITPLFCSFHKDETMVNVSSKKCEYPNCKIRPNYNFYGKKTGIFCSNHKLENMVDVKNKKCNYENCSRQPSFNYENEKKAIYCSFHKLESMVDIINKKCHSSQYCLGTNANPKYKGYCSICYQHLFPNDPLTFQIRSKTKEIAVRDYINLNFEGFQHDTPLWTGNCDCTHRRRIDHRKLIGNTLLCVETDENQHKKSNYETSCEHKRIMKLSQDVGERSIIFIRFNPDNYIKNKIKIASCWAEDEKHVLLIKNKEEWLKRLDVLKNEIVYWCNQDNKSSKTIEIKCEHHGTIKLRSFTRNVITLYVEISFYFFIK